MFKIDSMDWIDSQKSEGRRVLTRWAAIDLRM